MAVQRMLFARTDRLGETLLNLPAIAALSASFPSASLVLLVHPDLIPLLSRLPMVERVMAYPPGPRGLWWVRAVRLASRLRAQRFDLAVISNPVKELHVAVWLARIPRRVGYARKGGRLLTHRVEDRKALGEQHEVEYNLDLVRAIGAHPPSPEAPQQILPRFEREQAEVVQLLEWQGIKPSAPLIAVHPWSSNPRKQWPADRFTDLIRRLAAHASRQVVLIGGAAEAERASHVLPDGVPVANLVGQLTLTQLAALLQRSSCLVSNDSGPAHLAAAVGTKAVVLFGTPQASAGPRRWGPWGPGHAVIWKPAIEAITVEEVLAAV